MAAAVPLDAYGQLPSLENVALSPDGSRVAFVKTQGDVRLLVIPSLADGKAMTAIKVGEVKLRDILWADEQHVLLWQTVTGVPGGMIGSRSEQAILSCYDVQRNRVFNVMDMESRERTVNIIAGLTRIRHIGGDTVLLQEGVYVTNHMLPGLFKINLRDFSLRVVEFGDENTRGWLVDADGAVVATDIYRRNQERRIGSSNRPCRAVYFAEQILGEPEHAIVVPWCVAPQRKAEEVVARIIVIAVVVGAGQSCGQSGYCQQCEAEYPVFEFHDCSLLGGEPLIGTAREA
jgi:hypothetical protein